MRCDLHVHSKHSGSANIPMFPEWLECYSEPEAVYETARSRGMNLVTLTDHDSIDGAIALRSHGDTFVGEEVTTFVDGRKLHLGVYGIDERQHAEIAARRHDAESLVSFLAAQRIPFAVNHLFSPLTGRRHVSDIVWALGAASLIETGNAMLPAASNAFAEAARRRTGASGVGGSDSHALRFVARSYTVVPRARTAAEFLDGLRSGRCYAEGTASNGVGLTLDVLEIAAAGARSGVATARGAARAVRLLAFIATAPLWTAAVCASVAWTRLKEHTLPRVYDAALQRAWGDEAGPLTSGRFRGARGITA